MPLPVVLQKRADALQKQLLSEALMLELEDFLKKEGAPKNKARRQSFSDDQNVLSYDQEQNVHLEEALRLDHLLLLREAFASHTPSDVGSRGRAGGSEARRARRPGRQSRERMSLEEFQAALNTLLGSGHWASQTELLFSKVDASCDGYVDWDKFCSHVLLRYREKEHVTQPRDALCSPQPLIRHCLYNKQATSTRVLAMPYPPPLRYVSVSKEGTLTIWDGNLHLLKTQQLSGDTDEGGASKRKFRNWTTDAVCMPNVHKIAISTTGRDIRFFDVSTSSWFEEFSLFGLKNVPTSLSYWHNAKSPGQRSVLLWGDDEGGVNLLWFLYPQVGMFETTFTNEKGPLRVFMQDICAHSRLVSYHLIPGIHQEPVNRIFHEPHTDLIITSSGSASTSVVIMDVSLKKKCYIWKIKKGVTCFDFCKPLNLLVTAGMDPTVRLWNQYMTSRPVAALRGHCTTVLDVAVYEPLGQIFSYSRDAVLKVWDILSQQCLRTLLLKFPCVQLGRALEHGSFPFLLVSGEPHALLVSCRDYLGLLRLVQNGASGGAQPVTHAAPLSAALYNPSLKQVVTACDDSSVSVWDVETGRKSLQLSNAHGQEEITCMAFDRSHRRLVTGARNGTIKVWNLLNGQNIHKLEVISEAEVTGVVCLQDNQLLAVGWSQKIAQYHITDTNKTYVKADMSWKSGQLHRDDIQAVDHCPVLGLLATASFDGEMIVWTMDTQRPLVHEKGATSGTGAKRGPGRPTNEERVSIPVDKLLFLQCRAADREWRCRALLVSSVAGSLCWWNVAGPLHKQGHFYAPGVADASVLGLSSDQKNKLLVSGDTAGWVQVWDISRFALGMKDQATPDRPPLLHSWRAHDGVLVSAELLEFGAQLFLASASSDCTARLWTWDGCCVGCFGQEQKWSLGEPATYQHPRMPHRDSWGKRSDTAEEEEEKEEEGHGDGHFQESHRTANQAGSVQRLGETSQGTARRGDDNAQLHRGSRGITPTPPVPRETCTVAISPLDSPPRAQNDKVALGLQVEQELQRRTAARRQRYAEFGEINAGMLSRVGGICTPFQALATSARSNIMRDMPLLQSALNLSCDLRGLQCGAARRRLASEETSYTSSPSPSVAAGELWRQAEIQRELQEVPLPSNLPMSPWMVRKGLRCEKEVDLSFLPLSGRSSNFDPGEDGSRTPVQ